MKKNILIVGGTSGVGLELSKYYTKAGHNVCMTGRKNPELDGATYQELAMTHESGPLAEDIDCVLRNFEDVNTLIYAAGFVQLGHIDTLSDDDLGRMVNVGILAPMILIKRLKNRSRTPLDIILITSSSQYTPRELEPAYAATKSAMGMLGASLVRDKELGKVLVAAPSGIRTPFWDGTDIDTGSMLEPDWVAKQIVELSSGNFKYKFAKLLREPPRVEVVECLDNNIAPI